MTHFRLSPAPKRFSPRVAAALALLLSWGLFFAAHVFSDGVPYYRDHLMTTLPMREYFHQRLLAGQLPHWYPYEGLGVPVVGQIALGLFHPFTFLLLPLPPPQAVKWNLLLCYLAALFGAYRFARALGASRPASVTSALAYSLGGYLMGMNSVLTYATSQAAFPWVGWAALSVVRKARAKDVALLGLSWSTVLLAGDALGFVLVAVAVALCFLARPSLRGAGCLVAAGGVASLIASLELLPALEVARESVRAVGTPSPTLGSVWSFHPLRLFAFFVSGFVPDEVRYRVTGELMGGGTAFFATTLFVGLLATFFAVAGATASKPLRWAFVGLALASLWLALGDRGGLHPLARRLLPFLNHFRYPEKFVGQACLAMVPLVAFGFDACRQAPKRCALALASAACGAFALFAWAEWGSLARMVGAWLSRAYRPEDPLWPLLGHAWAQGLLIAGLFATAGAGFALLSLRHPRAFLFVPALVLFELWVGNSAALPLVSPKLLSEPNPFAEAVRTDAAGAPPGPRVLHEVEPLFPSTISSPLEERVRWIRGMLHEFRADAAGLLGLSGLGENLGAVSVRFRQVFGATFQATASVGARFGVCYRVVDPGRPLSSGESLLATAPELGLGLLKAPCTPRAFLSKTLPVQTADEALRHLREDPPGAPIPWEGGPLLASDAGTLSWEKDEPEHVALRVNAPAATGLILSDAFAPGWSATVDGQEVSLYAAQVVARGVVVWPGEHNVEFRYRTPLMAWGAAAFFTGVLAALALLLSGPVRASFRR